MEKERILPRDAKPAEVQRMLEGFLADQSLSDEELRTKIELLSSCLAFGGLTWLWGPVLYRRNRILFRPIILRFFATYAYRGKLLSWRRVSWKREVRRRGEEWMKDCEKVLDMELYDQLWHWKNQTSNAFGRRDRVYCEKLLRSFREADSAAGRLEVLERFQIYFEVDEKTACALYELDDQVAGPFLKDRLPYYWGGRRVMWTELAALAKQRDDEKLASEIYRRTVDPKTWERDVLRLADRIREPEELVAALDRYHPRGSLMRAAAVYLALISARGRDVLPYVIKHLSSIGFGLFSRGKDHKRLLNLAETQGWWDLWTAMVRVLGSQRDFDQAVWHLLNRPLQEARGRLAMLAGTSREFHWAGFSAVQAAPLSEKTALELYLRFPELLRRAFRPNLESMLLEKSPCFLPKLIEAGDDELIDYLAARWVGRSHLYRKRDKAQLERLATHYEALKEDSAVFARRTCAVLTQVPAYSIWNYNSIITRNRLARLLFERSPEELLGSRRGLSDLVEAQEIHVMALAYRVLGLDDPRAREAAAENLEILLGTLFRPLKHRTRLLAFKALCNAATTQENAGRILRKARESLDLPDKFYPKEELVGLIGQLLHRWPGLRGPGESPIVYSAA